MSTASRSAPRRASRGSTVAAWLVLLVILLVVTIVLAVPVPEVATVLRLLPTRLRSPVAVAYPVLRAVGDVVLFLPVGLLITRRTGRRWIALGGGLLLSCIGALVHAVDPTQVPSLAGMALNLLGTLIGAAVARPVARSAGAAGVPIASARTVPDRPRIIRARRRPRIGRLLLGTLALAMVVAGLATALLLTVVPTAADAEDRARTQAALHGVTAPPPATPTRVADALTATEDSRFYSTPGIDPIGVARWVTSAINGRPGDAGGATLEQQLAKMLYTGGRRTTVDQLEQVGLAVKLDHDWSKAQIMRMYLQTAYFGHGYYGLDAAARGYFRVSPARLDWPQAALLAGLVQAPSAYDPFQHPGLAMSRRGHVLQRLVATGHLGAAQARAYSAGALELVPR
jgi:hypothetical protein